MWILKTWNQLTLPVCDGWELEQRQALLKSRIAQQIINALHYSFSHLLIKSVLPDFSQRWAPAGSCHKRWTGWHNMQTSETFSRILWLTERVTLPWSSARHIYVHWQERDDKLEWNYKTRMLWEDFITILKGEPLKLALVSMLHILH